MGDALPVPPFARLNDYLGAWAVEPTAFASLWGMVAATDLAVHVAAAKSSGPPVSRTWMRPAKGGQAVAVVPITGTLMKAESSFGGSSTVQIRRDIRQAAADPNVSAILLAIDSPGGTVAGTADLAADVRAARRKKPVWAHVDDLAASAAYWVASQADQIFANAPTALVGSIGTVLTVYDLSQAAERDGVKVLRFATGPLKGAGTPGTPVTDEQAAAFQSLVDGSQTHFDAAVRSGRGLSAADLAAVRTGGVFQAAEAQARRLIDGVRSLDATLAALAETR